jgi:hypothetical protein
MRKGLSDSLCCSGGFSVRFRLMATGVRPFFIGFLVAMGIGRVKIARRTHRGNIGTGIVVNKPLQLAPLGRKL